MKPKENREMFAMRVPVSVMKRIRALSERYGVTRSGVVVHILEAMVQDDADAIATLRADVRQMKAQQNA
jgi:predicted DNA-binding protein